MDSILTQVSIDKSQIIEALTELSNDDLIDLIKEVDRVVADWEFTMQLVAHFEELGNEFVNEEEA